MHILVVGAYGLLGRYVTARLMADGHQITGLGRDIREAERQVPTVRWVRRDLRRMGPRHWAEVLAGQDAVVNCAGALQDGPRDDLEAVHLRAVTSLIEACAASGVRRLVQISAVGVEHGDTAFQRTKHAAEAALQASRLEWIVLRPGLVLAPAAYGGSALLRGLAAFPGFVPAAFADSTVQTVSVDDVAEAVARGVRPGGPVRFACDLVAVEETRLRDVLQALRGWLGFRPAPVVPLPAALAHLASVAADGLAWLGWRSPLRSSSMRQLAAGVRGRGEEAVQRLGFTPTRLAETLARHPAGVQERWFAKLYALKPMSLCVLAAFWIVSAAVGFAQKAAAARLLAQAGISPSAAELFVPAGSAADLALGLMVCIRPTARFALKAMVLLTAAYLAAATVWTPGLWADPLGPLVKSIPAAMLAVLALAMMDER